ncbi:MAG TPA: helix-turn-helix domain-containing protein [Candidatus Binataceae bacterium]|nr:helix-turn-helix domain-containing protein [Candidatus Binataceae bacterium]
MEETRKSGGVAKNTPRVLTVRELADYLRVHPSTVYRLLRTNQLPGFRIGSDWRFNVEVIDQWCTREGASTSRGSRGRRKRASNE